MTRIAGTSAAPRTASMGAIALWALLVVALVLAGHYFEAPARLRGALDGGGIAHVRGTRSARARRARRVTNTVTAIVATRPTA